MTQGWGTFVTEHDHCEELPSHVYKRILAGGAAEQRQAAQPSRIAG
jgi:hypothetical protein